MAVRRFALEDRPVYVPTGRVAGAVAALPPSSFFLTSAVFHYLGPSLAVLLFAHVGVLGVAWLRIASAAVVSRSGAGPGGCCAGPVRTGGGCCWLSAPCSPP